jgi:hypothetical protein
VCDAAGVTSTDEPSSSTRISGGQSEAAVQAATTSASEPREMVPDAPTDERATEGSWRALLAETAAKSDILWVRRDGERRAWPAWHVWHDDAVHMVSGGDEQELPPLDGRVEVLLRSKDTWQRLLTVQALASTVLPDDDRWLDAATALAAVRLNATVSPATLPDVWRTTATITRIDAVDEPVERPGRYDDASHAAPPPPTPATRSAWRPWHAGGRRRRRRR